jgi:hypothetical protein
MFGFRESESQEPRAELVDQAQWKDYALHEPLSY